MKPQMKRSNAKVPWCFVGTECGRAPNQQVQAPFGLKMNNEWTIIPSSSIGPIRLGMPKTQCESILGAPSGTFRRTPVSPEVIMAFDHHCLHVTLDSANLVVEVSIFRPRRAILAGVQLLGRPLDDVARELTNAGVKTQPTDVGLLCPSVGAHLVEVEDVVDGVELRTELLEATTKSEVRSRAG